MGARGPQKRPSTLTALLGNPGHRTTNHNEPKPDPIDDLTPPDYLDGAARAEWDRLSGQLHGLGLLTDLDTTALALYCQSFSDFLRYSAFLKENGDTYTTGKGYVVQRPEVSMRTHAYQQIKQMCSEFGFTPGARARMVVSLDPKQKAASLDEILNADDVQAAA